jgi:hypothetical protein
MSEWVTIIVDVISRGLQLGLIAGAIAGAITWGIIKTPEYLFRAIFGFALGGIGFMLVRGQILAALWQQIAATAGGAMPHGLATETIGFGIDALIWGLIGAAAVLAINSPAHTIRGAFLGGLLGIFLGIVLQVTLSMMSLPFDSIYYSPGIGILVLVIFSVFGAELERGGLRCQI